MVSDLTYKVLGFRNDATFTMNEAVDWAVEMMRLGYNGENLHILAGLTKPINFFEGREYLEKTLQEIGLKQAIGADATLGYAVYHIKQIAKGVSATNNLSAICSYLNYNEYGELFSDFYLLYWEWDEINHGNPYREYWPEATAENIEITTIEMAQRWLSENSQMHERLIKTDR